MSPQTSSSQTPPFQIYISHADVDKETIVRPLSQRLRAHGYTVFFDEEPYRPGDVCPEVMTNAMETAPVAVIILSPEFVAQQWPMHELIAFVRRYDNAKERNETPPMLIPVFYRFSKHECTSPDIFSTYSSFFRRYRFFHRVWKGVLDLSDMMHYLGTAASQWGIQNDRGITNSDTPDMVRSREMYIEMLQTAIVGKLGSEGRESSDEFHPRIQNHPPS